MWYTQNADNSIARMSAMQFEGSFASDEDTMLVGAQTYFVSQVPQATLRSQEIKEAIQILEMRQTPRMARGAALGNPEDTAMLRDIEDAVAKLRAELAGLGTGI